MIGRLYTVQTVRLFWLTMAVVVSVDADSLAQRNASLSTITGWQTQLTSDELDIRRRTAIATREADRTIQIQLLPIFADIVKNEKDGQVRLAVFDTLTDMGESAAPATEAPRYEEPAPTPGPFYYKPYNA